MKRFKSAKEHLIQASGCFTGKGSYVVIYVTALMVLLGGLWVAKESGKDTDLQMRRDLVRQATAIAASVSPANVRALSFTADDKNRPEFQRLSSQLRAYAEVEHIKSLYTMVLRNGQIVFGPESLIEGHPQASPPGTVYERPSQKDWDIFIHGTPQIQGPRSDEYGTFVTATAPVFDPRSGEVLAAIGIDVESSVWRAKVRQAQWVPTLITMLLLLILLLAGLMLKVRRHHSPQRNERRRHAEPVLCFVFLILLTLILVVAFDRAERIARKEFFHQMAQKYASTCAEEFYDIGEAIDQLSCFFESSQDVNRDEFGVYCGHLVEQGILQACVWAPAVPDAEADAFIQTVRYSGYPDFSIWYKNAAGHIELAASRSVYYPALYIGPQAGHETGFGYDLNAEPVRSAAIQDALRTGLATATDPLRLIALTNSPPGIFIFKPVNASMQKGLVAFVLRPENLLGGARFQNKKNYGLKVCLIQLRSGAEPLFVVGSDTSCCMACFEEADPALRAMVPVFRFGKAYILRLIPDASWLAANPLQHGKLAGMLGLLVTILITSLVWLITNRRVNLENQVDLRTTELQESEEKQRLLLQHLPAGVVVHAPDSSVLFANETATQLLGLSLEQMQGRIAADPAWRLVREDGSPLPVDEYPVSRVLTTGRPAQSMFIGIDQHVDASRAWVLVNAFPQLDAAGQISQVVVTFTDITDRKVAERQLAHRAELLAAAALISRKIFEIETLQDLIESVLNILGTATEQDRAYIFECHEDSEGGKLISQRYEWCRTGVEPQIGNPAMQNLSLAKHFSRWNETLQSGRPVKGATDGFPAEERAFLAAQNIRSLLIMPVFVEKAFWGFIGLDNCHIEYEWDSSEISILSGAADLIALAIIRKRTVESLAEAESRLRLAFEVAQMGHWRYDCKTDAVQWFEGHEKLYGISPETFKGTLAAVQEMVHPDDRSQGEENLRRTIEENVPFDNTYRVIHPDQSIHWLHSYGHLYCDADGGPSYVFGVTQEITGFKNAEAELKQRCDELELFHDVTVGRELRMIELKKEINALLETIGQPEKYEIIGEDT